MVAFKAIAAVLATAAISADAFNPVWRRDNSGAVADPVDDVPGPEPTACVTEYVDAPEDGQDNRGSGSGADSGAASGSQDTSKPADSAKSGTSGSSTTQHTGGSGSTASVGTAGENLKSTDATPLSTGAIAGIAVGATAGCALLGGGAYFAYSSMNAGAASNSASAVEMLS
eukprot:comp16781_c0_seq1/m.15155 comp16781_c0_seq1/g.15155  ORF comp16781_c0_seq1/g.15155 comp16781_c0_seq1/m.15155 type:complete len:171 (-) comp16781_c0_seq1:436-948(-)